MFLYGGEVVDKFDYLLLYGLIFRLLFVLGKDCCEGKKREQYGYVSFHKALK